MQLLLLDKKSNPFLVQMSIFSWVFISVLSNFKDAKALVSDAVYYEEFDFDLWIFFYEPFGISLYLQRIFFQKREFLIELFIRENSLFEKYLNSMTQRRPANFS